ncbi:MAG: hypothetical protein ACKPKO_25460, partial [Candidatus Fonsibacter sp.]
MKTVTLFIPRFMHTCVHPMSLCLLSGAIRLFDEAEVEAQSRDEDASLLRQLTSNAPLAVPEAPEAWAARAHTFEVEDPRA